MTLVLRKSIGSFSAGTPVEIIGGSLGMPGRDFPETYDLAIGDFDSDYLENIPVEMVVKRRSRSMTITTTGRKSAKKALRKSGKSESQ